MLKAYEFLLDIDTDKNVMFVWYAHDFVIKSEEDYQNEKKQRITKATVNKHKKRFRLCS